MPDYNYSPWYLEAHKETVDKLTRLADERGHAVLTFKDHLEARRYRSFLRGLLACLSLNRPEKAYVRELRTLIKISPTGELQLHIGNLPAGVKIRGAHPQKTVLATAETQDSGTIIIEGTITKERWPDIALKLTAIKHSQDPYQDVRTIIFTEHTAEMAKFLARELAPQFDIASTHPLTYQRVPSTTNASATDALPHDDQTPSY